MFFNNIKNDKSFYALQYIYKKRIIHGLEAHKLGPIIKKNRKKDRNIVRFAASLLCVFFFFKFSMSFWTKLEQISFGV